MLLPFCTIACVTGSNDHDAKHLNVLANLHSFVCIRLREVCPKLCQQNLPWGAHWLWNEELDKVALHQCNASKADACVHAYALHQFHLQQGTHVSTIVNSQIDQDLCTFTNILSRYHPCRMLWCCVIFFCEWSGYEKPAALLSQNWESKNSYAQWHAETELGIWRIQVLRIEIISFDQLLSRLILKFPNSLPSCDAGSLSAWREFRQGPVMSPKGG